MADTSVAITAGTGTNVDTRTEGTNGNHRQVVVIGDPATNAGVAPVDATTGLAVNVTNTSLTVASHAVTNAGTFAVQATVAAGATYFAKAEDVASADADVGVPAMAVRKATPANTSGADGDYEFLQMSAGKLWTTASIDQTTDGTTNLVAAKQSGTWTVTGAGGTFPATIAAGATAIAKAEDVASADADVGVPAMAVRKATPANTSGTDGDYEFLQMSSGRLWVDPSGVTLTVASHAVTVASAGIASGAIATGAFATGSVASGAVASGAFASGSIASGAIAAGAIATGATSIAAAEDDASANLDVGVKMLAVRQDTPANTGADGDYEFPKMSAGRLWTSGIVTAAATSIGKAEDAGHTSGDAGAFILGVRSDTFAAAGAIAGTDLDYGAILLNANGQVYVETSDYTNPTSPLTRPSNVTGYTALDLVASSTTSVVVPTITVARIAAGGFRIAGFRLVSDKTAGLDAVGMRVRLWSTAPTYGASVHDNDAYAVTTGAAGYLGKVDFLLEQFLDGAVGIAAPAEVAEIIGKLASGTTIAWDLQTLNDFTPASGQIFTLTAFIERK